jgi:hypothetical protein
MPNFNYLIETHSDELYERWLKEVQQNPDTRTYHQYPRIQALGQIRNIYKNLKEMIDSDNRDRIELIYSNLGADRFQQGFKLSEVLKALILSRRVLWDFIENHGFYNALEFREAMDFRYRILLFFDRAMFFVAKGYEQQASISREIASSSKRQRQRF